MLKKILTFAVFWCGVSNSQPVKVVDVSCEFNPIATNYSHKSWNSKMIKTRFRSGEYILQNSDDGEVLNPSKLDILDFIRIFNDKDKMYPIFETDYLAILLYVNGKRFDIKYDKYNKFESLHSYGKFVCIVGE